MNTEANGGTNRRQRRKKRNATTGVTLQTGTEKYLFRGMTIYDIQRNYGFMHLPLLPKATLHGK